MKVFMITDTDGNGEDRSLLAAARDTDGAHKVWQDYYEVNRDDVDDRTPDRIFETDLVLNHFAAEPFPLGWHNDHLRQVGGKEA